MRTRWNAAWAVLAVIGLAASAQAQDLDPEAGEGGEVTVGSEEPAPASDGGKPISAGLLLGYGVSLEDGGNPWGLGFGVRGGYNIDAIFLGARFVYYLGESEDLGPLGGEVSVNVWELGLEVGYDIDAGGVVIRPALGFGLASLSVSAGNLDSSSSEFFIAPGASVLYNVTDSVFVGLDIRFQLVLAEETVKAIPILATAGMRF